MKVLILDDNNNDVKELRNLLSNFFQNNLIEYEVHTSNTVSGIDELNNNYDIIFSI